MLEETKHAGKTAEIIELRKQGKTWTSISNELGIPRKSLYHLRHTEGFMATANEIWLQIWEDIEKQRNVDERFNLNEAIKNQIRLFTLMSGTSLDGIVGSEAKTAGCTEECPHYVERSHEKGKKTEFLWRKVIQIQPWQEERVINYYLDRPYEDIDETWKPPRPTGSDYLKQKREASS